MVFSSQEFLFLFLPLVLVGYFLLFRGMRRQQNVLLLVASLLFYAWGERWFVLVMLLSIVMNYFLGLWVHRRRFQCRRTAGPVAVAVACNLVILYIFKYLVFTVETINLTGLNLPVPGIQLPIGISFFTFQALSYVIDVARGRVEVQRSPLALGLYIAFFPQLIAGPIVKYETVAQQIQDRRETWADFSAGCCRFVVGLGKKILLSNQLAIVADTAWGSLDSGLSTAFAWLGSVCYILQLYYDFSGYSDMAIGLGRMFGFRFLENFDHPYAATSITDFWRRWHISLTSWFRDYVYIPLGGSRLGRKRQFFNLLVVWLLTGLWHGANWTFVCWGLFSFLFICLEKFLGLGENWPVWYRRLFALLTFDLGCVIFRADTLTDAGRFLQVMFSLSGEGWSDVSGLYLRENLVVIVLAVLFSAPFADWLRRKIDSMRGKKYDCSILFDLLYALGLTAVAVLCVAYLVKESYNPFIYFRF